MTTKTKLRDFYITCIWDRLYYEFDLQLQRDCRRKTYTDLWHKINIPGIFSSPMVKIK